MLPNGLTVRAIETLLQTVLETTVCHVETSALGASSRETPWRVDAEIDGEPRSFLLRLGKGCSRNEAVALRGMADHPIPTPRLLHWDPDGDLLKTASFLSEWIPGEPLLAGLKAGEPWAEALFIDTAVALQSIRPEDLPPGTVDELDGGESAIDVLEAAYVRLPEPPDDLVEAAYGRLKGSFPAFPKVRFSNGDLWPENLLVKERELAGVIDWQHAGYTDPIYEFLLPFFLVPELRDRGIEERYCRRMGYDPHLLGWYHGLEFFDALQWVSKTGRPYRMHTPDSLRADLTHWLARK